MEKGTVYFFTGLAGAGKTTIGNLFYEELRKKYPQTVLADGHKYREDSIPKEKRDYSLEARKIGAQNAFKMLKSLTDMGYTCVFCSISMFADIRKWARENIDNYVEIYIKADWEVLVKRNQCGLYDPPQKNVVGIDLPWDEPTSADIVIENNGQETPEKIVNRLVEKFLK